MAQLPVCRAELRADLVAGGDGADLPPPHPHPHPGPGPRQAGVVTWPRPATLQLLSAVLSEYEENFKLYHVTISLPSDHHH